MKAKRMLFALCLVVLLSTSASAKDGYELLQRCEDALIDDKQGLFSMDSSRVFLAGYCLGVMQGITRSNVIYQKLKQSLFCLPNERITNGQAARVVVKYLREHPEELHEDDTILAVIAFMEAFPCKERSRP